MISGGLHPIAAVAALSLSFAAAQGMSYPLLSILLQEQGLSPLLIGLSAAMTPLGILIGSLIAPRCFARFRLWTLGLSSGIAVAVVYFLIWWFPNPWLWLPLRLAIGVLINFQFLVADLTTLSVAPPGRKGRYVAIMAGTMQIGFAAGPATLALTGTRGLLPFGMVIVGCLLCALVIWMARHRLPSPGNNEAPGRVIDALKLAPVVLLAVLVTGGFEQSMLTLMPVYAQAHGLEARAASLLLTAMIIGSVAMTPLAGFAGERFGTRRSLIIVAAVAGIGAPLLTLAIESQAAYLFMALWGGVYYAIFILAFVEMGERFSGAKLVALNSAAGMGWGFGGLALTPLAGAGMQTLGSEALPWLFGGMFLLLSIVAWKRAQVQH
ncbi:MFS transporter [Gammaproteobacteria bacterium]|nr:MFS transporter [Gammaproteobacteria bacterium]